jgi:predicted nucleic acid-binding protein
VERTPGYQPSLAPLIEGIVARQIHAVSSVLALLEVLTGALKKSDEARAQRYRDLFENTEGVTLIDVDRHVAARAARLRARYRLQTPDAIHVATAIAVGAESFVTTDRRLASVREIAVRVLRPVRGLRR